MYCFMLIAVFRIWQMVLFNTYYKAFLEQSADCLISQKGNF